ncbi:hypothetical protein [Neobacillus cucumis]|uniref:hypothetical protein n=2 Tax=Neobacillus cucumis TaxID=1740721 RepID=UPI0019633001|nr:hypothetical protein [Neobacillus cucumis]MBM7651898.1 hypothetical protein [Neobacillus cucumis]
MKRKEEIIMVNENFDQFRKVELKHQGKYIGSDKNQQPGLNDPEYNNQSNTDKSPGATGRDL